MQHLRDREASIKSRVRKLTNPQVKRDLYKMCHNLDCMITELSKEAVECRRVNSLQRTNAASAKFDKLSSDIDQIIYKIEKYITMYSLLG